jgi:hypothetical protein
MNFSYDVDKKKIFKYLLNSCYVIYAIFICFNINSR